MTQLHEAKAALQQTFRDIWNRSGRKGTGAAATGVGKTKPAIDEMMEIWRGWKACLSPEDIIDGPAIAVPQFFVAVPTEELRDTEWPKEVETWYGEEGLKMWKTCVTCVCYISMHKYRSGYYDLVILDEGHHLTELSNQFFRNNICIAIMCLTATYPDRDRDPYKHALLHAIAPVIFSYPLEQGVEDELISEFEINVVLVVLDDLKKTIPAGTKAKPFMTTEMKHYKYISKWILGMQIEMNSVQVQTGLSKKTPEQLYKAISFAQLSRNRFIYNLGTKTKLVKAIMAKEITPGLRTLVFAGSIKQCEELCGKQVYHSKTDDVMLKAFKAKEIDMLGCVNALNEGVNIPDLDIGIISQVDSNQRALVQRVGRLVRYRPGHKARVWIACVQDTVDESWLKESLKGFNPERIKYLTSRSYGV